MSPRKLGTGTPPKIMNNNNPASHDNEAKQPSEETTSIGSHLTRRKAITGGVSALALGLLGATKAKAQVTNPVLVAIGGRCEGRIIKLSSADGAAWMQNMLSRSPDLQAYLNYFTAQGMSFIMSRAQVYVHTVTTFGATPKRVPNIFGILPSFQQVDRSAPSHTAVGLGINAQGYVSAGSVVVNHNPFSIQQFSALDLVPNGTGTPSVVPRTISASQLQSFSVSEVAALLGTPSLPPNFFSTNNGILEDADRASVLALTYQAILSDSYAAPLYPPSGFNALVGQTSLVTKFAEGNYQRTASAAGSGTFCCCVLTTCCCNGSTSTSLAIAASPNSNLAA